MIEVGTDIYRSIYVQFVSFKIGVGPEYYRYGMKNLILATDGSRRYRGISCPLRATFFSLFCAKYTQSALSLAFLLLNKKVDCFDNWQGRAMLSS